MKEVCVGKHLVIDTYNCDNDDISNIEDIKALIHELSAGINVTILHEAYHKYSPEGITGFAVVSASHISVHTWPEYRYIGVDIFSCKVINLDAVLNALNRRLPGAVYNYRFLDRVSIVDSVN